MLMEVGMGFKDIIGKDEDSIIIYSVLDRSMIKQKFIGEPKVEPTNIL
jgi:CRISPR/Cas system-associated endoribonuclease Cas2